MKTLMKAGCVMLVIAGLSGMTGCSAEAKYERHIKRADAYFEKGELDAAEIEYLNAVRLDESQAHPFSRLATIAFESGDFRRAVPALMRLVELEPEDLESRSRLALILLGAGEFARAREHAEFILERQPGDDQAVLLLSDTARTESDIEAILEKLNGLRTQRPDSAAIERGLASLHMRRGEVEAAAAALARAEALEPESELVQVDLGILEWRSGNLEAAGERFQKAVQIAPTNPLVRMKSADFAIRNGRVEEGREELEEIVGFAPTHWGAWLYLGRVALGQSDYESCSNAVEKVLGANPQHLEARMLRTRLQLTQGNVDEAITALERLKEEFPSLAEVHYQLGWARLMKGNVNEAANDLQRSLTLRPDHAETTLLRAEVNLRSGNTAAAISSLRNFVQRYPAVERAHLLLADAHRAQGNLDQALAVYLGASRQFPERTRAPFMMGLTMRQQERYSEARGVFEELVRSNPDYIPAINQLIELDLVEGRHEAALSRVDALIERHPEDAGPHLILARIHRERGDDEAREAALLKAVELQPEFTASHFLLAEFHRDAGRVEEALRQLDGVLARQPNNVAAHLQRAAIHQVNDDFDGARLAYEKVLEVNPGSGPALNNLAYLYSEKLGRLDEAFELARRAREAMPGVPHAADTFGWIQFRRGEYAWALSVLKEAADKLPDEPEVQYHLGMTHYMLGEEGAARVHLAQALQLSQDFEGHERARSGLGVLNLDGDNLGPEQAEFLEKRLDQEPRDLPSLLRLGRHYERNEQAAKARDLYAGFLGRNSRTVPVMHRMAEVSWARFNDLETALKWAREARTLAPNNPDVALLLGRLARETGDYTWSMNLLQDASGRSPASARADLELAVSSFLAGKVVEARTAAEAALRKQPSGEQESRAREILTLLRAHENPDSTIAEEVAEAWQQNPADPMAQMAMARLHLLGNRREEARKIHEEALKARPGFIPAMKGLALLLGGEPGQEERSHELATAAQRVLGADPQLNRLIGILSCKREDFARAAQLLTQATRQQPGDAEAHFYLGVAQHELNRVEESKAALERAIELDPQGAFVEDARRLLASSGGNG